MGLDDDPRPEILTTRFCRYSLIHPARLRPWERSPIGVGAPQGSRGRDPPLPSTGPLGTLGTLGLGAPEQGGLPGGAEGARHLLR